MTAAVRPGSRQVTDAGSGQAQIGVNAPIRVCHEVPVLLTDLVDAPLASTRRIRIPR